MNLVLSKKAKIALKALFVLFALLIMGLPGPVERATRPVPLTEEQRNRIAAENGINLPSNTR